VRKGFLILSLATIGLLIAPFKNFALNEGGEEIKLYLNEPKAISINNPTRVVIGNPNIIDVTNITKNECTINPKAVGNTSLVIWDNFGEEDYQVKVLAEDLTGIKQRVDNLLSSLDLPNISTRTAEEEGKLILTGRVKSRQDTERIMTALGQLKDKVIDLTVVKEDETVIEIDVQVLELDKDATNTLGFSWPGSITATEAGSPAIGAAGTGIGSFFRIVNLSRDAFTIKLDALVQEGKAKILSRPRLACQSGKEAELLVGGEKPIFTTSVAATTGATGTNIEYKEFGIKLKIKPTITEVSRIKVALNVK
jgi:pilus assembly protein CpaC